MSKPIILFIVEGEKRDYRFAEEMKRCFMRGAYKVAVINLPAAQNLYMLYQKLCDDDFETDVVELLRESDPKARALLEGVSRRSISQIYLFFDFDPHHDNLRDNIVDTFEAVDRMLEVFDNETEHGKLYISYPMVEALYDYSSGNCQAHTKCFIPLDDIDGYKRMSGDENANASIHMEHAQWKDVIDVFALRIRCLFDSDNMGFESYRNNVTPRTIFEAQRTSCDSYGVFVLSAFPEFLLDYFKKDFWNSHVKRTRYSFQDCEKLR